MATQTGSIASSIVGIRPRFYDSYAIHSGNETPGLTDIVQNITTSDRISEDDIMRKMVYVIDWKIVKNVSSDLLGLLMSQSFTNEHSDSLNTFEFKYLVDRTGPARETGYNTGSPVVTLDLVKRRVKLTNPRAVYISVPKRIYRRMATAMEEIVGLTDKERAIKPYLGEDGQLLMTPKWHAEVRNYMDAIKTRSDVALNSQNQGTNESKLEFLFTRAPDLKLSPSRDAIIAHDDLKLIVPNMIRSFLEYTFFVNKIMGIHLKKPTLSAAMSKLFRAYLLNTSENLMPELEPTFENTPFKRATGIITCTSNVRDQFASLGMITHAPNAVTLKKISYCQVGSEDLYPFDTHAPHNMVQQVDLGMFRQTENGSLRTFVKRVEAPIEYISAPEGNFVINVATEANFGTKNSMSKIGKRQITRYDEMIPIGFIVESGNHGDEDKSLKPAPQKTYYTDHHGLTRCLTMLHLAKWVAKLEEKYEQLHGHKTFKNQDGQTVRFRDDLPPLVFGRIDSTNGQYIHNKYSINNPCMYDEIVIRNALAFIRLNPARPTTVPNLVQLSTPDQQRLGRLVMHLVTDHNVNRGIAEDTLLVLFKRCYTHEGLLNEEGQQRFPSIYPGSHVIKNSRKYGHNYFYPGSV